MANTTYYARTSGNVNAAIWSTAPTGGSAPWLTPAFDSTDVLCANGISSVTFNVNTTVASVRNDAYAGTGGTATIGGNFILPTGVTLTANVVCGSGTCITPSGSTGTAYIVGSVTANAGTYGIYMNIAGSISITGTVTNNGANYAVFSQTGNITITGDVYGNVNPGVQVQHGGSGALTITGNVYGGPAAGSYGVAMLYGYWALTITGTAVGGGAWAVLCTATGPYQGNVTVTRAKGGSLASSAGGVSVHASYTGTCSIKELEYGTNGAAPTYGPIKIDNTSNQAIVIVPVLSGGQKTLTDPLSTGYYPATGDVRSGTTYAAGARTGTLAVPAASLVAAGTAVDNTTGTAAITSAAIQSACDAALAARNVATVATTGQLINDATW